MKLFLAVPRQSKQTSAQTVTSAGRTRDWAARLPLLNTRESLMQIHGSLHGVNRTTMRVAQRLRLLDIHRSPLLVIRGQVESQLAKGAAPLSQGELQIAGLFRDCCIEMAFGYKTVVLEVARSMKRRHLDEMKISMARALFYLEQTVFACALFRQSPPEGIWQEMHTVYNYGRKLGIAEDALRDPVTKVRTSATLSMTYRRALLFGLSDPFHQSVPLMSRVLEFLRQHAHETQIKRHIRTPKGYCQFVIDPLSDHPARIYVKDDKQKTPKNALFLDTADMTRNARQLYKRLQSAEQIDVELHSEFQDDLGRKLLQEVVYKWGLTATRGEQRTEAEHADIDIMIGIEAVNYCLNDESIFELSTLDNVDRRATGAASEERVLTPRRSQLDRLSCRILDQADSGLRITMGYDAASAGSLRVGDVLAYRVGDGDWTPALIRWMRCVDESIHFGVSKLPGTTRPVAAKLVSMERDDPFKPGLAVLPEGTGGATIQLVTPPGLYRRQRNLFVDDGHALLMTRARALIESSQTMEWFECETLNL